MDSGALQAAVMVVVPSGPPMDKNAEQSVEEPSDCLEDNSEEEIGSNVKRSEHDIEEVAAAWPGDWGLVLKYTQGDAAVSNVYAGKAKVEVHGFGSQSSGLSPSA